jgi:undecaprenyl-diphosphatase
LYQQRAFLQGDDLLLMATGTITAFVAALLVVRWLVGFVSRRTFRPFAWYRIGVGSLGLALLWLGA